MKKVVVIGSNSFSGSDFIDLLLEKEEYQVLGVSRSKEKPSLFLPYLKRQSAHFTFHQIDLNHDLSKFAELLKAFQPEYIVNFAAQSEVGPSWENPQHWFQTNAVATTSLVHHLKEMPFIKKYLHISSPEVYGSCVGFIKEDAPLNPSTPYAASKAAGDLSLFTYYKHFNFPLVLIRATNVYGAHQQLFKIIPRAAIAIKNQEVIELHGGGEAIKSYIHIRDVSRGELLAMEKGRVGEIYHLSPSQGVAVKDLVNLICRKMGADPQKVTRSVHERLGQDKAYTIDSSKIREELGWKSEISLEKGIDQTLEWIESHIEEINQCSRCYIHKA